MDYTSNLLILKGSMVFPSFPRQQPLKFDKPGQFTALLAMWAFVRAVSEKMPGVLVFKKPVFPLWQNENEVRHTTGQYPRNVREEGECSQPLATCLGLRRSCQLGKAKAHHMISPTDCVDCSLCSAKNQHNEGAASTPWQKVRMQPGSCQKLGGTCV